MAHVRIEIDRGNGWQVRQEGDCDVTEAALLAMVPSYVIGNPHRFFIDGRLIGEFRPACKAGR